MDFAELAEMLARDLRIGIRIGLAAAMCYTTFMIFKLSLDLLIHIITKK